MLPPAASLPDFVEVAPPDPAAAMSPELPVACCPPDARWVPEPPEPEPVLPEVAGADELDDGWLEAWEEDDDPDAPLADPPVDPLADPPVDPLADPPPADDWLARLCRAVLKAALSWAASRCWFSTAPCAVVVACIALTHLVSCCSLGWSELLVGSSTVTM